MKSDRSNNTRFAQRTLEDFTKALLSMLEKKRLEEISVNELCEAVNYPRSTFYNYFVDIFDLLDDCWETLYIGIHADDYPTIPHEDRTNALFDFLYSYMDSVRPKIRKKISHNAVDGKMCESLKKFMRLKIGKMIFECPQSDHYPLSLEIIAEHYANTIWMVLEHSFLYRDTLTKAEAITAVSYLLGTLEAKENGQ